MGNRPKIPLDLMRRRILFQAANSFLEIGYTDTYLKDLAEKAEINIGSLVHLYPHKEDILLALVDYVLGAQFFIAKELVGMSAEEPAFLYVMDTALELHMAESAEHLRDLYVSAYTIPVTANRIYSLMTERIAHCFSCYNPRWSRRDFYAMEIGSAAMMRGFISVPCSESLTIEEKVRYYQEASLRMYRVPPKKIKLLLKEAEEYDFRTIAAQSIRKIQEGLKV